MCTWIWGKGERKDACAPHPLCWRRYPARTKPASELVMTTRGGMDFDSTINNMYITYESKALSLLLLFKVPVWLQLFIMWCNSSNVKGAILTCWTEEYCYLVMTRRTCYYPLFDFLYCIKRGQWMKKPRLFIQLPAPLCPPWTQSTILFKEQGPGPLITVRTRKIC